MFLALLPIIVQVGSFLLNLFVKDQQKNQELKARFDAWVEMRKNDGMQSAKNRQSYQDQLDELNKKNVEGDK